MIARELLFAVICLLTAFFLLRSTKYRNFKELSTHTDYRTKGGRPVKIVDRIRIGNTIVFVDNHDVRYFRDGWRVGVNDLDSKEHLFHKL